MTAAPAMTADQVARLAPVAGVHQPEPSLTVLTASQVCALPDPPKSDELLGSLVVRGYRIVVGGHSGEGKTTAVKAIVAAVAHGSDFLDWKGTQGRVLFVDLEQGLKTVKRRLREAGLHEAENVDYIRVPDGLSLDRYEGRTLELEAILAAGDYSLVVLDPLYKAHTGDSNDERQAVDLMRRLDAWRETYRFALVLPVHCRKPGIGTKFTMHEFFGQSAYLRGAEVVLGIQRVRQGYSRLHFFKDRDGDLPIGEAWGLLFDRERGFQRDPDDEKPKQTAGEAIREMLEATPGMTAEAIAAETGYAERTVRKALREMGADGKRAGAQGEKQWTLEEGL